MAAGYHLYVSAIPVSHPRYPRLRAHPGHARQPSTGSGSAERTLACARFHGGLGRRVEQIPGIHR
jgi:hypothetical protein